MPSHVEVSSIESTVVEGKSSATDIRLVAHSETILYEHILVHVKGKTKQNWQKKMEIQLSKEPAVVISCEKLNTIVFYVLRMCSTLRIVFEQENMKWQ